MPPKPGPARPPARKRAPGVAPLPLWGAVCFFLSGAAGLLYEVVWSKQLAYLLGNSTHAVATVVAAFLGGLALGARFLGTPLARRGSGAQVYAALEVGVGLLGLLSLPVLRGVDPLIGELYRSLGGESAGFAAARFLLLFVLLLPPAALMGATLPVLVGHFEHQWVGPALARLYALNTFGAVAGSLAGGFVLLPGVGLTGTACVAAALNLVVAALAWSAGRRAGDADVLAVGPGPAPVASGSGGHRPAAPAPADARAALPGPLRLALAIAFALSGFSALAFQVAWVRLYGLAFGSSVYSFSAILGVYLFGLALGSALVSRAMARGVTLAVFARLQLALAAAAAFMLHGFARLPQWMYDLGERSATRWGSLFVGEVGLVAMLILVPCVLLGAAFPVATRLLQKGDGGEAAGFAYAVNTLGTIAGSLAAGFLMIPALGVQGTHLVALLIALAIGLASLLMARAQRVSSGLDLLWAGTTLLIVAGLAFTAPRWDPSLMSTGLYRPTQAMQLTRAAQATAGPGSVVWKASRQFHILYYREGVNGSVLVGTDPEGSERWLRVSGKVDASTLDMETQVLLGLIPAALADSGARTLVIGLGSGITAAAALAAGAGETDVVELEQGVVEGSRFFHGPGENPLDDPRVHLTVGDARTRVWHGRGRYGLIVSEPSNPWIAGVNNLFTVDFYRRLKSRLEPDGVFCQWLQVYELSPATFGSLLASFLDVFGAGRAFVVWRNSDVLLVAAPEGRKLSLARLASPAAQRMLERARIRTPRDLAAYYAGTLADLRPAAKGAPLNRDDRPIVEYRAPRDLITVGRSGARLGDPAVMASLPFAEHRPAGELAADWSRDGWYESRARRLADQGDPDRADRVAKGARAEGLTELADRLNAEVAVARSRQQSAEAYARGRSWLESGREAEGQAELERAGALDPMNGQAWLLLADRRRLAGDSTGAEAAIAQGRKNLDPEIQAAAEGMAGMMDVGRNRPRAAAEHFRSAQRLSPKAAQNYVLEAQVLYRAGDLAGARAAVDRGLAALPGDPRLTAIQSEMGPK
jgi:spermidine synthase